MSEALLLIYRVTQATGPEQHSERNGLITTIWAAKGHKRLRLVTNFICNILAALSCASFLVAQYLPPLLSSPNNASKLPKVLIFLPKSVPSESVQGQYMQSGPFGGSGGYIKATPNVANYEIEAGVNGSAANAVRIILYAEGCQTEKLVVFVRKSIEEREFVCEPLPTIAFRGEVSQFTSFHAKDVQIEFDYLASWACEFFGLVDCMVPTFLVATVTPDRGGSFSVALPDLYRDRNEEETSSRLTGEFNVVVRERRTGNILGFLRPRQPLSGDFLKVAERYPPVLQFEPKP